MAIEAIDVKGYRSIRDLYLQLGRINVLVGPNACGKSNLYNAMYLLHAAAGGQFAHAIATEGGMASALWAGGDHEKRISYRSKEPVRMHLGVSVDGTSYRLSCGLPIRGEAFNTYTVDPSKGVMAQLRSSVICSGMSYKQACCFRSPTYPATGLH